MTEARKSPHLKLVGSAPNQTIRRPIQGTRPQVQPELFPLSKPWLLIFADTSELSGDYFVTLLNDARPTFVLDIRPVPRFDMGRLNRKKAFKIFRQNHIRYIDVAGLEGVASKYDVKLNPTFLVDSINKSLKSGTSLQGPILLLFDNRELLNSAIEVFPKTFLKNKRRGWDVCLASMARGTE